MDQEKDPLLVAGRCLLDWERYRVVLDGKFLALPLKRLRLLEIFLANADRVLSRDEIRRHLWNSDPNIAPTTINKEVERLRICLGGLSADCPIETVRGKGYVFSTSKDRRNVTVKGFLPLSGITTLS